MEVGDKVIISYGLDRKIDTVARLTKTQIVLENGDRYNRTSGRLVGKSSWCGSRIREASEEELANLEKELLKKKLVWYLRSYDWERVDVDLLWKVVQLMKKED